MAKSQIGKIVAKAAATGGGRTSKGHTPFSWYATLVVIVVLGITTVAYSRYQYQHPAPASKLSKSANANGPTTKDSWTAGFVFDICGSLQPNPPTVSAAGSIPRGFTTDGDGLIHIQPLLSSQTGKNATLGAFVSEYPDMVLTSDTLRYPGGYLWKNGDKCGGKSTNNSKPGNGKPGVVQVEQWSSLASSGTLVTGNPGSLPLKNGQLITLAFLPVGAHIPKPPVSVISALLNALHTKPKSPTTQLPHSPVSLPPGVPPPSLPSGAGGSTHLGPSTNSGSFKSSPPTA
ncbi:MAG: hypothetical protein M1483_06695 [Actinobacteria bacterium]|nr:hypothetical protein [Actinomycetota bacterium]MCL6105295.1 hypothetical protein [Actinomycetota bacterium]